MYPIKAVIDTGAAPNILHTRVISPVGRHHLKSQSVRNITDAGKNRVSLIGLVTLVTQMGSSRVRLTGELCLPQPIGTYWVAINLEVDCILGKSFMGRYVRPIIPRTTKVVPEGGAEVALIGRGRKDERQPSNGEEPISEETPNKVRLTREISIPPKEQARDLVCIDAVELGLI